MDEIALMLPADFNPLHFQAAPPDQRMPYPQGGEPIRLMNLVPPAVSRDARALEAPGELTCCYSCLTMMFCRE